MKLINPIRRICLWFAIRSLEIHYADQSDTLKTALTQEDFIRIYLDRMDTQMELAKVRSEYNALLPVGQRKTWRIA